MAKLTVPVNAQDHAQGEANAPCTLVEYGDYQCPLCGDALPAVKGVQRHFGDRVRFVFRNFPLQQHPFAEPAAEAAEFAAAHGKFWEMHDALYKDQDRLSDNLFGELATKLGLDAKAMHGALRDGEFAARVETDLESGEASGVEATPTFYINGQRHNGAYNGAALIEAIDAALRG